jgi:hypothetical protein
MPIDLVVTLNDQSVQHYYIPLSEMRAEKPNETSGERKILSDWSWAKPSYSFELPVALSQIQKIEIDPTGRMADVDASNNAFNP